jgi:sugar phosphate isomerase/epimerase
MKNRLGLHANVWVAGWSEREAARAIDKTAEFGFDLIEISAMDLLKINVDDTRRRLEHAGIGVTMSLGLDAQCDISSADPAHIKAGERHLTDVVAIARDLGATHVCGILYSAEIFRTADGRRRRLIDRGDGARRRKGGGQRHHLGYGSRQPIRDQHPQYCRAGRRILPPRRRASTSII